MSKLRHFHGGRLPQVLDDREVTLIWVSADGEITFGSRGPHKVEILNMAVRGEHGRLLAVWIGKMRSDVFEVDDETLTKWAAQVGIS